MADFVLQDILVEILKRLPVQCLLRFKCVQKSWYHLIRSTYFIDLHYRYRKSKNNYLLFRDRYHSEFFFRVDDKQCKEYYPGLRFPNIPDDMQSFFSIDDKQCSEYYRGLRFSNIPEDMQGLKNTIHGTCRGLICFSTEKRLISSRLLVVYLWNPATRIYKLLPCCRDTFSDNQCYRGFALGYFPKINDYKVIKFQSYNTVGENRRRPTVHIFSLSTNSWKTFGEDALAQFERYDRLYNSVIVNGVAYWIGIRDPFMKIIVCFDIENEKVREIMLPPQYALDVSAGHFSSLNLVERFDDVVLSAAYMNYDADTPCILDILSLGNGDGEDVVFTKKVTIDLGKVGHNWWPIGFRCNGEIVLFNYDYSERRRCLAYDHEKDVVTEILDHSWELWSCTHIEYDHDLGGYYLLDAGEEPMQFMYVNSFQESLVSLGNSLCLQSKN